MSIHVKDKAEFDAKVAAAGDRLVVLDFFATWCPPCMNISPFVDKMADTYADKIIVIKVDVDKCEDIAAEYEITCMPTFVFLKNGQKIENFEGSNEKLLEETIKKYSQ